jgi:hypothetical protein
LLGAYRSGEQIAHDDDFATTRPTFRTFKTMTSKRSDGRSQPRYRHRTRRVSSRATRARWRSSIPGRRPSCCLRRIRGPTSTSSRSTFRS